MQKDDKKIIFNSVFIPIFMVTEIVGKISLVCLSSHLTNYFS